MIIFSPNQISFTQLAPSMAENPNDKAFVANYQIESKVK